MTIDQSTRYGAATGGIGFVGLVLVAVALMPSEPALDAPASEVASFYVEERSAIQLTTALIALAPVLLLWFIASLWGILRAAEGGAGSLSAVAFGAGVITVAGFGLLSIFDIVAAFRPEETSPELLRALNDAALIGFAAIAPAIAAFFLATGLVVLRTGVLPAWLGWLALLAAATNLLGIGNMFEDSGAFAADGILGFTLGFIVWLVWVLATSAVIVMRGPASR